jgi:hypothetical protein
LKLNQDSGSRGGAASWQRAIYKVAARIEAHGFDD